MKIHLVTHTHWDREWYRTYQEFRIFLVRLMDEFLDYIEREPSYSSFMLDGQTVQLEDYLEVRPDQRERLQKAIRDGKLIVGPMYIQPDEYLPSGESLIRNFLIGMQIAGQFGRPMSVGYLPDSFGHCSQMPQLLRGLGMQAVVLWRGLCDEDSRKTEMLWESRDGSQVLLIWMPYSYGNAHLMGLAPEGIRETLESAIETMGPMATTDNILLMKGWDHSGFSPDVPEIVRQARRQMGATVDLVHGNLEDLVEAVRGEAPDLEVIRGELRKPKMMRIHAGISSTRMDIKQAMVRAQTQLERFTEPLSAFSWIAGRPYPTDLINRAWKYVLQSQAHDSICCCCTDEALRAVKGRFRDADEVSQAIERQESMAFAAAVQTDDRPGHPIILVNLISDDRNEVVETQVLAPWEYVALERSDGTRIPCHIATKRVVHLGLDPSVALVQPTVERTEGEILEAVGQRPDDPAIYYDRAEYVPLAGRAQGIKAYQLTLQFPIRAAPAMGYETLHLVEDDEPGSLQTDLICDGERMENANLAVRFLPDGSFDLLDKRTGRAYPGLHIFEDSGDAGDSYNFSPPVHDRTITSHDLKADIEPMPDGPLCVGFRVRLDLPVPGGLTEDGLTRSETTIPLSIVSEVRLFSGSERVEIRTLVDNRADDHRLRVHFPTGVRSEVSFAEEQFGVIRRLNSLPQQAYWAEQGWVEEPLPVYPQQRFVDVNDGEHGLAILNRDLTEYQVVGEAESVIALTLLRGVGAMGRPDLVIRPGRASGLEVATPAGLCHGQFEFHYAIFPHSGDSSRVAEQATRYNVPLRVIQAGRQPGTLPPSQSFLRVTPPGLVQTCFKRAERVDALILRLYNATNQTVDHGTLALSEAFQRAVVVDLKEDLKAGVEISRQDGVWGLPKVKPGEILTLKLVR